MFKAASNSIIFKFVQDTDNHSFENKTDWGLVLKAPTQDAGQPRWGKVVTVGPNVESVSTDDYVLVEPLMWTNFFEIEGSKYWRTNEEKVMLISKTEPTGLY